MPTKTKNQKNLINYYGFTKTEQKKYPVVTGILKQLTPERIEKEIEEIQNVKPPPKLQKWIKEYEKFGTRDEFIWRLFLKTKQEINYLFISKIYQTSLQEVKFLLTMFVVLLDDVVDREQNEKLFNELLKVPFLKNYIEFKKLNKKEKKFLNFTLKLWRQINLLIKKYPEYEKFEKIFKYDIKQIINAMEYSCLINKNYYLINKTEYWLYSPHTLQFVITTIFDLMCLSKFDMRKLKTIREITWEAQKMVRIGNCVSTWEREIKEGDFTGGIFAYAISLKILSPQELISADKPKIIKKIKESKIENELLKEWENCYRNILNLTEKVKIINIQKFLHGLEKIFMFEIISKKYK